MSLPVKKNDSELPVNLGPKVLPMRTPDSKANLDELVAEEVDFVLQRASNAARANWHPVHHLGEGIAQVGDQTMQAAAALSRRGVTGLRDLAEQDPIRFVAVAAAAGFAAGVMLRIWRSPRA